MESSHQAKHFYQQKEELEVSTWLGGRCVSPSLGSLNPLQSSLSDQSALRTGSVGLWAFSLPEDRGLYCIQMITLWTHRA